MPFSPTKDAALQQVNKFLRESADENAWGFVDFHQPLLEINHHEQQKDPAFTFSCGDRIHPDNNGHMAMALSLP